MQKKLDDYELKTNSLADFNNSLVNDLSKPDAMYRNLRYGAITNDRGLLSQLYMENGLVQTMIDAFVDDGFRGGIIIRSNELDADDLARLDLEIEQSCVLKTYAQGLKWARLFGGGGIIINCGQDNRTQLDIDKITTKTPIEFYSVDRWELAYQPKGGVEINQIKQTKNLNDDRDPCPYNYYGEKLHKSRVIRLMGKEAPSLLRGQFSGWGMSEIERLIRSWNQYQKNQNVTYELLDEAKVDVFKMKGFASAVSTKNGAEKAAKRMQMAAQVKNYQNALCLDSEDDYQSKQITFSGLSEVLEQIRIGLACDVRMPLTRLFGISAAGFSSGEDDLEVYDSNVESEIRSQVKGGLILILKILCKKLFDYVPEHISFEFKPLREMSEKDKSVIKNDVSNRILSLFTNGLISNEKAIELINNEKIFNLELNPAESMSLDDMSSNVEQTDISK